MNNNQTENLIIEDETQQDTSEINQSSIDTELEWEWELEKACEDAWWEEYYEHY